MTIELTRELLERYLRATGVEPEGAITFLNIFDRAVSLNDLGDTTIFRLGLCAAAESRADELQRFREYEKARPTPSPGENRGYWAGRVDEIERMRKLLLRAAGIEPDAWEAAK